MGKNVLKKKFFRDEKNLEENQKNISGKFTTKKMKICHNFPKYLFRIFSEIFFISKKLFYSKLFYPYKSKIFPGIQKSYLENHSMNLNT